MATHELTQTRTPKAQPLRPYEVLQYWPIAPVIPIAVGVVDALRRPHAWSARSKTLLGVAGAAVGLNLLRWQFDRLTSPQPHYQVVARDGRFEIRRYPALVVAETHVEGADFDRALDEGFDRLAGFIFGKNVAGDQLEMTSPVVTRSETVPMTSPVTTAREAEGHTISFIMPPGRTLQSLPVPFDDRVRLRVQAPRTLAVLRFTGRYDADSVRKAKARLLETARSRSLELSSAPLFAGYDGPSTLPFLRRNEVWAELVDQDLAHRLRPHSAEGAGRLAAMQSAEPNSSRTTLETTMKNPIETLGTKVVGIEKGAVATAKGLTGVFKTLCVQHGEAATLLSRARAATEPKKRAELWAKIRTELLSHEKGELATVYPELREHVETRAFAERHDKEAADLEVAIKAVDAEAASSESWLEKLDTVITLVTSHVDEEEHQIFPEAERVLGEGKTVELDKRFMAKKAEVAKTLARP